MNKHVPEQTIYQRDVLRATVLTACTSLCTNSQKTSTGCIYSLVKMPHVYRDVQHIEHQKAGIIGQYFINISRSK